MNTATDFGDKVSVVDFDNIFLNPFNDYVYSRQIFRETFCVIKTPKLFRQYKNRELHTDYIDLMNNLRESIKNGLIEMDNKGICKGDVIDKLKKIQTNKDVYDKCPSLNNNNLSCEKMIELRNDFFLNLSERVKQEAFKNKLKMGFSFMSEGIEYFLNYESKFVDDIRKMHMHDLSNNLLNIIESAKYLGVFETIKASAKYGLGFLRSKGLDKYTYNHISKCLNAS